MPASNLIATFGQQIQEDYPKRKEEEYNQDGLEAFKESMPSSGYPREES